MFVEITVSYHDVIMGKAHEQYGASFTVMKGGQLQN